MSTIETALRIAVEAHAGQQDRDGAPVILHSIAVGLMGVTDEEKMAGFLHDVVEDSALTPQDLLDAGIPAGVVEAVRLLTHDKTTPYAQYIENIIASRHPVAMRVKLNDLQHNYQRGRHHADLQEKYRPALERMKAAVDGVSEVRLYPGGSGRSTAVFAGGCFWGVQHAFGKMEGVAQTFVGYTGGGSTLPSYDEVRNHLTEHVEAVLVEYDPNVVTYVDLCKTFFEIHDPAQVDGVGPDFGPQYRSCIFYADETQRRDAESVIEILRSKGHEVNTLLLPAEDFWMGEEYHQRYYEKTGGEPYCHVRVKKF